MLSQLRESQMFDGRSQHSYLFHTHFGGPPKCSGHCVKYWGLRNDLSECRVKCWGRRNTDNICIHFLLSQTEQLKQQKYIVRHHSFGGQKVRSRYQQIGSSFWVQWRESVPGLSPASGALLSVNLWHFLACQSLTLISASICTYVLPVCMCKIVPIFLFCFRFLT